MLEILLIQQLWMFFYWLSPMYRKTIIQEVVDKMNMEYERFMKVYPDFSGKISFLSHSLGSVISYFVLCNQNSFTDISKEGNVNMLRKNIKKNEEPPLNIELSDCPQLSFEVDNLYLIGSPLGMFLTVQGCHATDDKFIPKCNNVFNIIHPSDPVAYRIEPWINNKYIDTEPPTLPQQHEDHFFTKKTNMESNFELFGYERFDYFLPIPGIQGSLTVYTNMLSSHASYWKSREAIHFVVSHLNQFMDGFLL